MLSRKRVSAVTDIAIIKDSLTISISHAAHNGLKRPAAGTFGVAVTANKAAFAERKAGPSS